MRLFKRLGSCSTYASAVSPFLSYYPNNFEGASPKMVEKYSFKKWFSYIRATLTTLSSCSLSTPITLSRENGASTYLPSNAKKGLIYGLAALTGEYSSSNCTFTHPGSCSNVASSRITRKFRQVTTLPF